MVTNGCLKTHIQFTYTKLAVKTFHSLYVKLQTVYVTCSCMVLTLTFCSDFVSSCHVIIIYIYISVRCVFFCVFWGGLFGGEGVIDYPIEFWSCSNGVVFSVFILLLVSQKWHFS